MSSATDEIRTRPRATCYLCGSRGEPLYQDLKDRLFGVSGAWNLKRCPTRECGLVWLDPMPSEEDIGKLYATYLTHTSGSPFSQTDAGGFRRKIRKAFLASGFGYKVQGLQKWTSLLGRLVMTSRFFRDRVGSTISWLDASWGPRLIDVGCGNGDFLARMRGLGWDVIGVEPDPKAAQLGRERYGLTIYPGALDEIVFSPESFDAVTMAHVIEHLTDPLSTLKAAKRLLKKGGRLLIHTPNVSSIGHQWFRRDWRGLEPPRHLFLFSPNSLSRVVEMAGFSVLDLKTVFADSIWKESYATQKGLNLHTIPKRYARLRGRLFMILEHLVTGWPFYRAWGDQLTLIAVKY